MSQQPDEDQSTDQSTENSGETAESGEAGEVGEVGDAQLPEDLQPGEGNPLATHPEQTGDQDDQIGADREEDPETAPLTRDEADYGSGAGGGGGDGAGDGRATAEEDDGSNTLENGGGGAG
jgi:hypothetical protein